MKALYLIGPPGVGKTSALFRARPDGGLPRADPYHHLIYPTGGIILGLDRPSGFGGTDALPMDAIATVERHLAATRPPAVVGEGDRLACNRFFAFLLDLGYELTVALLSARPSIVAARRAARGEGQSPAWVAGRHTKTEVLAVTWSGALWIVDAERDPNAVAADLAAHPALLALTPWEGRNPLAEEA